jgi:hypothetical protein
MLSNQKVDMAPHLFLYWLLSFMTLFLPDTQCTQLASGWVGIYLYPLNIDVGRESINLAIEVVGVFARGLENAHGLFGQLQRGLHNSIGRGLWTWGKPLEQDWLSVCRDFLALSKDLRRPESSEGSTLYLQIYKQGHFNKSSMMFGLFFNHLYHVNSDWFLLLLRTYQMRTRPHCSYITWQDLNRTSPPHARYHLCQKIKTSQLTNRLSNVIGKRAGSVSEPAFFPGKRALY